MLETNPFLCVCVRACSNFMRQQAMASKMVYNRPVPVNRLVSTIADSASLPLLSTCFPQGVEGSLFIIWLTRKFHSRGPGKHAGIRKAPIWCRLPCRRSRPHRPTFIRVLAERHFVRVLCCFDRCAQPKRQDVPREALRVLCRLYCIFSFLFASNLILAHQRRACVFVIRSLQAI